MFIIFEGLDGSGKSTMLRRVYDKMTGDHKLASSLPRFALPIMHRFPSPVTYAGEDPGGGIGRIIRDVMEGKRELEHQVLMYLFMAEAVQADGWIRDQRRNHTLLVDRHAVVTGPVYQQDHHAIEDVQRVYQSHRFEIPDLVLLFDVRYENHIARRRERNNQSEDLIFERDDRERFIRMSFDYLSYLQGSNPCIPADRFELIDANPSLDEVEASVWAVLKRRLT